MDNIIAWGNRQPVYRNALERRNTALERAIANTTKHEYGHMGTMICKFLLTSKCLQIRQTKEQIYLPKISAVSRIFCSFLFQTF